MSFGDFGNLPNLGNFGNFGSFGGTGNSFGGFGETGSTQLVVFTNPRTIGDIVIDCTLVEGATDELEITQQPVENSANITDHAIIKPCVATFRALWSNSSQNANGNTNYAVDVYNQLLSLQQSRQPIAVGTGKRQLPTALIRTLTWQNDHTTDQALVLDITIQQVILVQTASTTLPPTANQGNPASTAGYTNSGSIQPVPSSVTPDAAGG